ncbi:hypothetical protein FKM82_022199 [Ascaphus truei]
MSLFTFSVFQKGKPFELAVDVGCGTGRYTRPLAPHFEKVIGLDLSESQINEARRSTSEENVLYHTSPAEEMPLKDASVDLVFAGLAAHWFIIDKFMQEAARVLKPGGCLALHAFIPLFEIQYQDVSETLTAIITEVVGDYLFWFLYIICFRFCKSSLYLFFTDFNEKCTFNSTTW